MRASHAKQWVRSCIATVSPEELHRILTDGLSRNWNRDTLKAMVAERIHNVSRKVEITRKATADIPAADIETWLTTLDLLAAVMPRSGFTWIRDLELAGPINGTATLAARTEFQRGQVEAAGDEILAAMQASRASVERVKFTVRRD